jgi:signal transduction histidine kinase
VTTAHPTRRFDSYRTAASAFAGDRAVPSSALAVSLTAMAAAVGAAVLWPEDLLDHEVLAYMLALIPALLLAHYRGWMGVSLLLAVGMIVLCAIDLSPSPFTAALKGSPFLLLVVAPYVAIALGAGWFGEVRGYQAELRTTQLQLVQSEKLDSIGQMAAGVAHEVKNPLMTILIGVRILSKRMANGDEATQVLLQDMSDAVTRANKIISGLLGYARDRDLALAPVDLNGLVERSLTLVKHELQKARIRVVSAFDRSLPPVTLDEFKIEQVLVNVLTNAVHAIGVDGEIRIKTSTETLARGSHVGHRRSDRYVPGERVVLVEVEDSGPGIPAQHLRKVFDPFFTTKAPGLGTGLGLSVSRQIVEMHGGLIDLSNCETAGARATMIFKLGAIAPFLPVGGAERDADDMRLPALQPK